MVWGDLISAGAALIGGAQNRSHSSKMMDRQEELQKAFAQQGIRWRVNDAKAAGIHPLFALGASTPGYSAPAYVGDGGGGAIADAGQHIGRAVNAALTKEERADYDQQSLGRERARLENDLLRAQIGLVHQQAMSSERATRNQGLGPPLPSAMDGLIPGQGNAPTGQMPYAVKAEEIPATQPGHPDQVGGAIPHVRWQRTDTGFKPLMPSQMGGEGDLTEFPSLEWQIRNRFLPSLGVGENPPPDSWLPKNATGWMYHPIYGEYRPYTGPKWGEYGPGFIPRRK